MDKQWKTVPVEPTPEMVKAAFDVCEIPAGHYGFETGTHARNAIYTAMLAAAPQPPSASDDDDECAHEFVMFQSACVRCGQPYEAAPSASDERDDEVTQPCYDLAWKHGALPGTSFAGDELESITFDPASFESFCAALAPSPGVDAAERGDTHSFKNFHRSLCDRFEYCHDERDWRRDQVSLIEHIAKRCAPAPAASAEWLAEAERLVHRLVQSSTVEGAGKWPFVSVDQAQAALLAHLKERP